MRKADNLPLSCAVVMKSGNLKNPLGTSGPVTGLLCFLLNSKKMGIFEGVFVVQSSCCPT